MDLRDLLNEDSVRPIFLMKIYPYNDVIKEQFNKEIIAMESTISDLERIHDAEIQRMKGEIRN